MGEHDGKVSKDVDEQCGCHIYIYSLWAGVF